VRRPAIGTDGGALGDGPAVAPGQDPARGAGRQAAGAVADPEAGDREMGNGHGEAELQCSSHPVVPVPSAVTLPCWQHARRAAPMRAADLSCG
jgi:hypothetical protein